MLINELHLAEITFAINSHVSSEGSGTNNDRFLGRSVRNKLPNSVNPKLNTEELIYKRIKNHEGRIKNKNKTNKRVYLPGDRVMLQNIKTKDFHLTGTLESQRLADDGKILS